MFTFRCFPDGTITPESQYVAELERKLGIANNTVVMQVRALLTRDAEIKRLNESRGKDLAERAEALQARDAVKAALHELQERYAKLHSSIFVEHWLKPDSQPFECLYCGASLYGKEDAIKHVQQCEKNPLVSQIQALNDAMDSAYENWQRAIELAEDASRQLAQPVTAPIDEDDDDEDE